MDEAVGGFGHMANLFIKLRKALIPLADADFDSRCAFEAVGKLLGVGAPEVVGVDDLRLELLGAVGGFSGWHGVRKIHTDEGDVNVLEGFHLRSALGVAGKIETLAA